MSFSITAITGLPLFKAGDDLVRILFAALKQNEISLQQHDVLVFAQKVISKVENRQVRLADVTPSPEAKSLAIETEKDPRVVELILQESSEVVRKKPGVIIVRHKLGHVGANGGIDQSNIDHTHGDSALLLPKDPDASAQRIYREILEQTGIEVGVLISDSANRPWRLGTVGIAIGAANTQVLNDFRGSNDLFGRDLKVTMTNQADAIASAANLVIGETTEANPIALVRGLKLVPTSDTAKSINRPLDEDLFR